MSDEPSAPARTSFKQLKIEHYLERAEEYCRMGRYQTARKTIQRIYAIDPENMEGRHLDKRLETTMKLLSNGNGNGHGHVFSGSNGNGTQPESFVLPRRRRDEIVLVVDQDEQLLVTLTDGLLKAGFQAISAGDCDEAVEILGSVKPHAVVSEVNFQNGPAGLDLFTLIRTHPVLNTIPFLFLATRIDREVLIAGKRFGVNDFITKPLDVDVVVASLLRSFTGRTQPAGTN